jgi:hypothetical protein
LSEGIYYLKLSGLNGVSNKKIVVKRWWDLFILSFWQYSVSLVALLEKPHL